MPIQGTLEEIMFRVNDQPNIRSQKLELVRTDLVAVKVLANLNSAALATKEPIIAAGTTSQYWRGDKTWQTLDKAAVGLSNVDNTSDLNKPISTATQAALANYALLTGATFSGNVTVNGTVFSDTANTDQLYINHPSSGAVTIEFVNDYLRYRFGGSSTPQGITIGNYDTIVTTLGRDGTIDATGRITADGGFTSNGDNILNVGSGYTQITGTRDNAGDTTPSSANFPFSVVAGTAALNIGQDAGDVVLQGSGTGTAYDIHLNKTQGKVWVGGLTRASNAELNVRTADAYIASVSAYGSNQGMGKMYVGQSSTYGGGIAYDGDGTHSSFTADHVTIYRRSVGVDYPVIQFAQNSNNVTIAGNLDTGGKLTVPSGGFDVGGVGTIDASNTTPLTLVRNNNTINVGIRYEASNGDYIQAGYSGAGAFGIASNSSNINADNFVELVEGGDSVIQSNRLLLQQNPGVDGFVGFNDGSTTRSGYTGFYGANGVRHGYIGYTDDFNIIYQGEGGRGHRFNNDVVIYGELNATVSLNINGGPELTDAGSANNLRVTTSHGYIDIGPTNTSYCHITTNISRFYFNKPIYVNGTPMRYNQGAMLYHNNSARSSGAITTSGSSPSGGSDGDIWLEI